MNRKDAEIAENFFIELPSFDIEVRRVIGHFEYFDELKAAILKKWPVNETTEVAYKEITRVPECFSYSENCSSIDEHLRTAVSIRSNKLTPEKFYTARDMIFYGAYSKKSNMVFTISVKKGGEITHDYDIGVDDGIKKAADYLSEKSGEYFWEDEEKAALIAELAVEIRGLMEVE